MRSLLRLCAALTVGLAGFGATAFGQTAQLAGRVTDSNGSAVSGAEITATNVNTNFEVKAASNKQGNYIVPLLPPGNYRVMVKAQGFSTVAQENVTLETGLTRTVDVQLQVGSVSETVNVRDVPPLLETDKSSVGQFIERATVYNMPVNTRQSAQLVRLAGNVVYNNEIGGPIGIPIFSVAGGRSRNQMWQLDGGVTQDIALGTPQLVLNPPLESLQEFKIETNTYSAEFGRSGNGFINMTTRSGSNDFHAAVYEFFRNDALDARSFFAGSKAPLRYNLFGASAGGRIIKDKTFYFVNYEGARQRVGATVSNTIVPHPAEINGDFSARRDLVVIDPATGSPFPGNIIPANRINPIGQALLKFFPAPNTPNNDVTRAPGANYITNVVDETIKDFVIARGDHHFGAKDRVTARFVWFRGPTVTAPVFPNAAADARGVTNDRDQFNTTVSYFRNFTPALINEVRVSNMARAFIARNFGFGSGVNEMLQLPGVDPQAFPRINLTGFTTLGSAAQERIQSPVRSIQIVDTLTWVRGNHQLKTGFDFRYSLNSEVQRPLAGGSFSFDNRVTGSAIANLLLGRVVAAQITDLDRIESRTNLYSAFVQDDWKVTRNLTLNLGLRYDLDTPRFERSNRQSGFDPIAINPVSNTPGVVTFAGQNGVGKYSHDFDQNNFGPRVGFAYRWRDKTVVRGGYGISYNAAYEGGVTTAITAGYGLSATFNSADGGLTPVLQLGAALPTVSREAQGPGFGAVVVGGTSRFAPDFIQQNQVNGYAQQWNLTIQRELPGDLLLETAYVANVGHHLAGPDAEINMIPLVNGRGPERQDQRLRLFPQFSSVILRSPPWGNSSYHSLNVKLEKRYSGGLNFLVNYTWSKFLDDVEGTNELAGGPGSGYTHWQRRAAPLHRQRRLRTARRQEAAMGGQQRVRQRGHRRLGAGRDRGVAQRLALRRGRAGQPDQHLLLSATPEPAARPEAQRRPVARRDD